LPPRMIGRTAPPAVHESGWPFGSLAEERQPNPNAPAIRPGAVNATGDVVPPRDPVWLSAVVRPEHRFRGDRPAAIAATRDVWSVLAQARAGDAPWALAAARDAVFRRYLPMARTLAHHSDSGGRPVDPLAAGPAAELGLAQAVLGWRRPDGAGFDLFVRAAIAAQLDGVPPGNPDRPGHRPAATIDDHSPGPG